MKKTLVLLCASLMMLVSCRKEESTMNKLVGTYSLIGSEYVTWGRDQGTLNVNSTITFTPIGSNSFMVTGFYQTTGHVIGNMIYFDSYRSGNYTTGYLDIAIHSTMLIGNQMNITDTSSGKMPSNGILYPYTGRVNAIATKIY